MQRYFIYLAYDGTDFHGWQVQPNASSVQAELEKVFSLVLREQVKITGAGRTDTGVHAQLMVAHFDWHTSFFLKEENDEKWLVQKLNRMLPSAITLYQIMKVSPTAHARFDAQTRSYHYYLNLSKNPFKTRFAYRIYREPDFFLMNKAAEELLHVVDFTSFSKLHTDTKTNNCNVSRALWVRQSEDLWRFEITADRFLRNMVRAIVGTLLQVGLRTLSLDDFKKIILLKNRCSAGDSAPGNALFLVDITYPDELFLEEKPTPDIYNNKI